MEGGGEEVADDRAMNISLKDLSKKLEEFAKARDWEKYHSPRNLLLAMVIKTSSILIYLNNLIFLHACMNLFMSLLLITKHWIFYLFIYAFIYFSFCLAAKSLLLFASKIYLNVWSLLWRDSSTGTHFTFEYESFIFSSYEVCDFMVSVFLLFLSTIKAAIRIRWSRVMISLSPRILAFSEIL